MALSLRALTGAALLAGAATKWAQGSPEPLVADPNAGPWVRDALRFDASAAALLRDLQISRLELWSSCR